MNDCIKYEILSVCVPVVLIRAVLGWYGVMCQKVVMIAMLLGQQSSVDCVMAHFSPRQASLRRHIPPLSLVNGAQAWTNSAQGAVSNTFHFSFTSSSALVIIAYCRHGVEINLGINNKQF